LSKFTKSSSQNRPLPRDRNVKPDAGITESCEILPTGERGREKKEYCKRFLSDVEVTRTKNWIVCLGEVCLRGDEIRKKKAKKIIVIRVLRSERGDDLFREREEAGVRPACSVTICLKIHEIRA